MRTQTSIILAIICVVFQLKVDAQETTEDSLLKNILVTTDVGEKILSMDALAAEYFSSGREDEAFDVIDQMTSLSEDGLDLCVTYRRKGNIYRSLGESDSALFYYQLSYDLAYDSKDTLAIARANNNMGAIYSDLQQFDEAIEYMVTAAEYYQHANNLKGAALAYSNIGVIHYYLDDPVQSKKFCLMAIELAKKGSLPDIEGYAYQVLGGIAFEEKKYDEGKDWMFKSIELAEESGDLVGVWNGYFNLAGFFRQEGQNKFAEIYYLKALEYADSVRSADAYVSIYKGMAKNYEAMNKSNRALGYYKEYMAWYDTLLMEQNMQSLIEMQAKFETEQTQKENELLSKENKIKDLENREKQAEIGQSRIIIISVGIGLLLVLGLAFVLFNRNRLKTKTNRQLEQQRDEIAEQKKEITDSITYAKHIQNSFLPSEEDFHAHFEESFLMYQPKDIVAGDFYILEEAGGYVFFSVADCTGHGVPGAMVSIVCNNAIRKVLHELNEYDPGRILDKARDIVIAQFERKGHVVNDGMDISFCRLDKKTMELQWAGANNALLWIKNGGQTLNEIKPNKQPIGGYVTTDPFTTHKVQLSKGDLIYMTSDGYPDQFGGEKGKKYKYKRFKELLLKNAGLDLKKQKANISSEFFEWKAGFEQIDDVCVMGVKV